MSKLVSIQQLLRQHGESAKVIPGVGWEKRVASLERMRAAMKNSHWGTAGSAAQVGGIHRKAGKKLGEIAPILKR